MTSTHKLKKAHTSTKSHTLTKHKQADKKKVVHRTKHKKETLLEKTGLMSHLEMYAFWTGVASTLVSLIQVFIHTGN